MFVRNVTRAALLRGDRCFSTASCDFVVIGAGVMGLNSAYQIKRAVPTAKVVVLESGGLGESSSGASSAVLRNFYNTDDMMQLGVDGIGAYKDWKNYLQFTSKPRAEFVPTGALWFYGKPANEVRGDVARFAKFGLVGQALTPQDVKERWPCFNICQAPFDNSGVVEHHCQEPSSEDLVFFEENAGYFDPLSSLQDLQEACLRDGVHVRLHTPVAKVSVSAGRCTGVVTSKGEEISAGCVISASGPFVNSVLKMAGVSTPFTFKPVRIQVVHKNAPEMFKDDQALFPVVLDLPGGVYFRPQVRSKQIVVSTAKGTEEKEEVDPSQWNTAVDPEFRSKYVNSLLHRLTTLEPRGQVKGHCGLYTMSSDMHPVIGMSELPGFFLCNGFSGHGFKHAPAVGSLVAQMVTASPSAASAPFATKARHAFFLPTRAPIPLADDMAMS